MKYNNYIFETLFKIFIKLFISLFIFDMICEYDVNNSVRILSVFKSYYL